jgi:hypothetical protein
MDCSAPDPSAPDQSVPDLPAAHFANQPAALCSDLGVDNEWRSVHA